MLVGLLIGFSFLLIGAEYISWWLYKLVPLTSENASSLLSEGVGYLFQVLGLLIFSFLIKKERVITKKGYFFPVLIAVDILLCGISFFSLNLTIILTVGFAMNFVHGLIFGYYLTQLTLYASKQHTGMVFAAGYAFGTVVTYLLSSVFTGSLGSSYIFIFYLILGVITVIIDYMLLKNTDSDPDNMNISTFPEDACTQKQLILAALVVFLFSFIKNIGFYFPAGDIITGAVDPILVRCTYAIGLIIAGIVNDKSRRYGSICCLCALVFPFLVLALKGITVAGVIAWVLGYLFFGFFSVYRVVVFSDISRSSMQAVYLAGFGMMWGRVGDASSAMLGIYIGDKASLLILITTLLFIVNIFIYFRFYNQVYVSVLPRVQSQTDLFAEFLKEYDISQRESEVFRQLLNGLTNSEIAEKLFISESTVKFHVRNILKKTASGNRKELIKNYHNFMSK